MYNVHVSNSNIFLLNMYSSSSSSSFNLLESIYTRYIGTYFKKYRPIRQHSIFLNKIVVQYVPTFWLHNKNSQKNQYLQVFICFLSPQYYISLLAAFFFRQLLRHSLLKVRKFQNENMKSSHCPKYERKNLKNSALSIQGRIFQIFSFIFWAMG